MCFEILDRVKIDTLWAASTGRDGGKTWKAVDFPWISLRNSTMFYGCSLLFHGFPWFSMDFQGFLWISMIFLMDYSFYDSFWISVVLDGLSMFFYGCSMMFRWILNEIHVYIVFLLLFDFRWNDSVFFSCAIISMEAICGCSIVTEFPMVFLCSCIGFLLFNGLLVSDAHIHNRYMCKVGYRSKEPS